MNFLVKPRKIFSSSGCTVECGVDCSSQCWTDVFKMKVFNSCNLDCPIRCNTRCGVVV